MYRAQLHELGGHIAGYMHLELSSADLHFVLFPAVPLYIHKDANLNV